MCNHRVTDLFERRVLFSAGSLRLRAHTGEQYQTFFAQARFNESKIQRDPLGPEVLYVKGPLRAPSPTLGTSKALSGSVG